MFAPFVRERDAAELPSILAHHETEAPDRGRRAREERERWFSPEQAFDALIGGMADLHARRSPEHVWVLAWPLYLAAVTVNAAGFRLGRLLRGPRV